MNTDSPPSNQAKTLTFTPQEWINLSNALNEYRITEQKWEEATANGNWDDGSDLDEHMNSQANSVVDIMLHVCTQQFPEGAAECHGLT